MNKLLLILAAIASLQITLLIPSHSAKAQERFILVIDGSGSMWGQVDGEPKISILRSALGDVLSQLTTTADVGVIAFGHREKGNCADIEEIVPPSAFDRDLLQSAIESINPKGKTPLSESVRQAANSLRYTEEKATVVILGDGQESCGQDPCATAEELELTGVDFIVHAIAFDIAEEEGVRQLKCFATETGGQFIAASDSIELVAALEEVKEEVAPEPEPEPEQTGIRLLAIDESTGAPVSGEIQWTLIDTETEAIHSLSGSSGLVKEDLPLGNYEVFAQIGDSFGETTASIVEGELTDVTLAFAASAQDLIQIQPEVAAAGSSITVKWQFEGREDDILFISPIGSAENRYPTDDRQRYLANAGQPGNLVAPAEPGDYEVRYYSFAANGILHRAPLTVTAPEVTINGPDQATAGGTVEIDWSGPEASGDILFIARSDWELNAYPSDRSLRIPANSEKPTRLRVPGAPGQYEYRYFSYANAKALLRVPVEIVLTAARVEAPATAAAGSLVSVDFSGPGHDGDRLFIISAGTDANRYLTSKASLSAVQGGSPATLTVPSNVGTYEVRYFSPGHGGLLAKATISVTAPDVEIDSPRTTTRGASFKVRVRGPELPGDFVFIAEAGLADSRYPGSSRNRFAIKPDGGHFLDDDGFYVLNMVAPANPGTYDIRYFSWPNAAVLDRRALIVR